MAEDEAAKAEADVAEDRATSSTNDLSGTVVGPSVQASSIYGGVQFNVSSHRRPPIPAQLPSPGFFANRQAELSDLQRVVTETTGSGTPMLVVITGTGGVGKTTLGLHWLHQIRDRYAAGQLFIDLQGFSGGEPMPSSEPLERFLRALGISAESVPIDPDEQAAMFRSLTADRPFIVMLDNAASAAQVRPLLPGPGPALVVVTTRRRLSGLVMEGAHFVDVRPLDESGAVDLLNRILGQDRVQPQRQDAESLVRLCGLLPLAVCASAARLAARRHWPIARVVAELNDETRRLSTLRAEDDDMSVQAVFNASYHALPSDGARRQYRLLGLHPGTDFDVEAAAALAAVGQDEAADLLDTLVGANLLQEGQGNRYQFHDLLRLHARGKTHEDESAGDRHLAFARLTDWYLRTAVAADLVILPGRWRIGAYYTPDRRREIQDHRSFEDSAVALDWLELERPNLLAVVRRAHEEGLRAATWQLCEALWPLFLLHKHYRSWVLSHEIGLEAAEASGDLKAQARMLTSLGYAHLSLAEYPAAIRECTQALRLEQATGHLLGQASALEYLGIAQLRTGNKDQAIDYFTRAREIDEQVDHPRGVALMKRHIGDAHSSGGDHDAAISHYLDALRFFADHGEHYHEARTLARIGNAHLFAGHRDEAARTLSDALAITRQIGARHEEAGVHTALARLAAWLGDRAGERDHLEHALAIFVELGVPQAEEIKRWLAGLSQEPPGRDLDHPP